MHKLTQNKILITLLTFSFLLACFTGCGEDTNGGINVEPPPLPPDSSMTIDLSTFGGDKLGVPVLPDLPGTKLNFTIATATALIINTAVVAGLATPVAIFTAAKNETPVEQDDGSWLWSYSKTIESRTFTATLTGKEEGDKTLWSMKISSDAKPMPLANFEWYTGTSAKDNTSGSWQFYDLTTPDQANPTVAIEWQIGVSLKGVKSELIFTNQKADSSHVGDVLRYSVEDEIASINFTEAAKNTATIIEWNLETTAGGVTIPSYNKGEKACWDENKQDVVCE